MRGRSSRRAHAPYVRGTTDGAQWQAGSGSVTGCADYTVAVQRSVLVRWQHHRFSYSSRRPRKTSRIPRADADAFDPGVVELLAPVRVSQHWQQHRGRWKIG